MKRIFPFVDNEEKTKLKNSTPKPKAQKYTNDLMSFALLGSAHIKTSGNRH